MPQRLILASGSSIRRDMLQAVRVPFDVQIARVDETNLKRALQLESAPARDIADALAELKARKVSEKAQDALVLGCDQVLEAGDRLLSKPRDRDEARAQLAQLRGTSHRLWSAAVMAEGGRPVWRHVGKVTLQMRAFSDAYLDTYLDRNWPGVGQSVGAYKLEEEGARLMSRIDGDHFNVLGMPLLEILDFLATRGVIDT